MITPVLISLPEEPDWDNVIGGSAEADWLADRDRKVSMIMETSSEILHLTEELRSRDALFHPTAPILQKIPHSIDWYVSLAGFSLKTLGNLKEGPINYGLKRRARGVRDSLIKGHPVHFSELDSLARWLKDQIEQIWPKESRSEIRATLMVSSILGGRVIGQNQNAGGNDAVMLLKSAVVDFSERNNLTVESEVNCQWYAHSPDFPALLSDTLRIDGALVFKFPTGGDTPDFLAYRHTNPTPLAVGEVKGRKDRSNIWESWMPQVVDHMWTWSREYPKSLRLFFGTIITREMVEGESTRGTERRGLRSLQEEGYLHGAYNLAKLAQHDRRSVVAFDQLMTTILR